MEPKDRFKIGRESSGLKQAEFGAPLGLSQANVRDLESGKVKISTLHALAIEKIHGISSVWLLNGQGEMKAANSIINQYSETNYGHNTPNNVFLISEPEIHLHDKMKDVVNQAFLNDWLNLTDVVKMRVWTLVKEELEKQAKKAG